MQMPQVEQIKTTVCKSNHLLLTAETFRQLRRAFETPMDERRRKARSASKRNKVKWRYSNKSEETASETAETPASAPEA